MTNEHKHAELLRMAADNADQLFEYNGFQGDISRVLIHPDANWRPVKQTKKIKRWLWATHDGLVSRKLFTEQEVQTGLAYDYIIKLTWSETEFEVDDEQTN